METLFRLPPPRAQTITPAQLKLLDWLMLGDGMPPVPLSRPVLRELIRRGLVVRIGNAPALYLVTGFGRVVRSRRASKGGKA